MNKVRKGETNPLKLLICIGVVFAAVCCFVALFK